MAFVDYMPSLNTLRHPGIPDLGALMGGFELEPKDGIHDLQIK